MSTPLFVGESLEEQLRREATAMASHALTTGLKVPADVIAAVNRAGKDEVERLAAAHGRLAQLIAPATPRTVLLFAERSDGNGRVGGAWGWLGPVSLVRYMLGVATLSLAGFIAFAVSPNVGLSGGDLKALAEWPLLINLVFLLFAASIGSAFSALFIANHYISTGTYDPKYEATYWLRWVLGIMSGFILAVMVPIPEGSIPLARPLLALLGGFSASVVNRILERLIQTVESLVQGDPREALATREKLIKAEAGQQVNTERMRLAQALTRVEGLGATPVQLKEELRRVISGLSDEPRGEPGPWTNGHMRTGQGPEVVFGRGFWRAVSPHSGGGGAPAPGSRDALGL